MSPKPQRKPPSIRLPRTVGELLCRVGVHNYELKEQTFDFGGASVAKYQCTRCGKRMSRSR